MSRSCVQFLNQAILTGVASSSIRAKTLKAADLFCGAGGTSTALIEVAEAFDLACRLTGVNHWPMAIKTHQENHPGAEHLCEDLHGSNPYRLFKEFELDVLWASPSCSTHSAARGGRPIDQDQDRATPWCVMRWLEACKPAFVFVENVPQFTKWGPVDSRGEVIGSREGEIFHAWVHAIEALGYRVDWRILCAADYGDPTTRERFFLQAVRGKRRIVWPLPTHAKDIDTSGDMFRKALRPWVAARTIIDWSLPSSSIFNRKKPLVPKTMKRIWAGFRKYALPAILARYGGAAAYVMPNFGEREGQTPRTHSLNMPLPSITSHGAGCLVEGGPEPAGAEDAFFLSRHGHDAERSRPLSEPIPTITGSGAGYLIAPKLGESDAFLVPPRGAQPSNVDQPLGSVCANDRGHRLIKAKIQESAYLVKLKGTGAANDLGLPLHTVQAGGGHHALVESAVERIGKENDLGNNNTEQNGMEQRGELDQGFIVRQFGQSNAESLSGPLSAVVGGPHRWLTESVLMPIDTGEGARPEPGREEAFLVQTSHGDIGGGTDSRVRGIGDPLPTVCGHRGDWYLIGAEARLEEATRERIGEQRGQRDEGLAYLVKYFRTGITKSLDEPVDTVTSKHRFGLVEPELIEFDPEKNGLPITARYTCRLTSGFSSWICVCECCSRKSSPWRRASGEVTDSQEQKQTWCARLVTLCRVDSPVRW